MEFDYSALRGRITEKYGTSKKFAEAVKMLPTSLSMKLNNKQSWKQADIEKARVALDIDVKDLSTYFFCVRSSNN